MHTLADVISWDIFISHINNMPQIYAIVPSYIIFLVCFIDGHMSRVNWAGQELITIGQVTTRRNPLENMLVLAWHDVCGVLGQYAKHDIPTRMT